MANKVVDAVTDDDAIRRITKAWLIAESQAEATFSESADSREAMARIAFEAMTGPQSWDPGEVVPRGCDVVVDDRQLRWVRDVSPEGAAVWICYAPEDELTQLVGPVTEDTDRQQPGQAEEAPLVCQAKHPEDDRVTCQVHHHPASRHPWRHSNFDQAISWLEENPPDHGEQEAPEAPATVAITQEAVTGLVDLLHQAAVKFTRLNTAYKGSATKGANTLAAECEQASQLLQSVIDGKETKE